MIRAWTLIGCLAVALCGSAVAENASDRSLEENLVISPNIITGKVTKEAGDLKVGDATFKKCEVQVTEVLRAAEKGPKKDETVTAFDATAHKAGEELVLLLGNKSGQGYRVSAALKPAELEPVKKMLELEARADKELDGAEKLRAAFFLASRMRPVALAAAEKKETSVGQAIEAKDKDKLLSILSWALTEAAKKDAAADVKRLSEGLLKAVSGPGGLPDYATRNERITQFWADRLAKEENRRKYSITKVELAAPAEDAGGVVVAGNGVAVAQKMVIAGRFIGGSSGGPQPVEVPKPAASLTGPPEELMGKPVNGLQAEFAAENETYNFFENPNQPVNVTLRLRNTGSASVRVNTYQVFAMLAEVWILDPVGRYQAPFSDRGALDAAELPAMGVWSFKELKPGEAISFTQRIPTARFNREGEYKICLRYKNDYGKQFGVNDGWTGEVVSASAAIKIVAPGTPPAKPDTTPSAPSTATSTPTPTPDPVRPPIRVLPVQPRVILNGAAVQGVMIQGQVQVQVQVQAVNGAVQKQVVVDGKEVKPDAAPAEGEKKDEKKP